MNGALVRFASPVDGLKLIDTIEQAAKSLDFNVQRRNNIVFTPGSVKKEVLDSRITVSSLLSKSWWGKRIVHFKADAKSHTDYESANLGVLVEKKIPSVYCLIYVLAVIVAALVLPLYLFSSLSGWYALFALLASAVMLFIAHLPLFDGENGDGNISNDQLVASGVEPHLVKLLEKVYQELK